MKKIIFIVGLLLASITYANACEFTLKVVENEKTEYNIGDEVVVEINLRLVHKDCPYSLNEVNFTFLGVKMINTSEWTKTSPYNYSCTVKIKITESVKKRNKLIVYRNCPNGGGSGSVRFKLKL